MRKTISMLPLKQFSPYYRIDVYRFLYASYLSEREIPKPPWLVPEEAKEPVS